DQPGWKLTSAYAERAAPQHGFEGSTVFIGNGPTYDAPMFVAGLLRPSDWAVDGVTPPTTPSIDSLMGDGEPIEVAGATGAVLVTDGDPESGLTGPIVTLFWPLGDEQIARVNAV